MESVRSLIPSTPESQASAAGARVLRTHGNGPHKQRDHRLTRKRQQTAPKQMQGLAGFGLEVAEYVNG
jgi:3,4-dihydroxy 2-butanone 4-phosphate synthase/GTP cyclohydrolase II